VERRLHSAAPLAPVRRKVVRLRAAARLVDTDDTKTMKEQHPHETEGM